MSLFNDHTSGESPPTMPASVGPGVSVLDPRRIMPSLDRRRMFADAKSEWLMSFSADTRSTYDRDLGQFLAFVGVFPKELEYLAYVRPTHVTAWRDDLRAQGLTNSTMKRKMTAIRGLYSYLQDYGYAGTNPAQGGFRRRAVGIPGMARPKG